jgi:hypothetical protein
MSRRGRWLLALLAVAMLLAALLVALVWRQAQPERLTPLLLRHASTALGLELRVREPGEFALRPEPRLLLHGLQAYRPGEPDPLFVAERVELSLPWATLRGRALEITRIEVDAGVLDLPATLDWLASRPATDTPLRLPVLGRGIRVLDSTLVGDGWRIDSLQLDLPGLAQGQPTRLDASGQLQTDGQAFAFSAALQGAVDLAEEGLVVQLDLLGIDARGDAGPTPSYRLATAGTLSQHAGGWRLDAPLLELAVDTGEPETDLQLALQPARLGLDAGAVSLQPAGFTLDGGSRIPGLQGRVEAMFDELLSLQVETRMQDWPADWPALPEPLASSPAPLDARLDYHGALGLDDPLRLQVERDGLAFDTRFVLAELLAWRLPATGSPLPPLRGRLDADVLVIDGVRLEGLRVRIGAEDDAPLDDADDEAGAGPEPRP